MELSLGGVQEDRVYGRNAYQSGNFIRAQLQENLVVDSLSKNEVVSARSKALIRSW